MILHNFMSTEKIIMKRKLLTLIVPLLGTFIGYSQPELTLTAPTATTSTGLRAPNGTTAHTTVRGVIVVTAAELLAIPSGTTITKLNMLMAVGATPGPAGGTIQFYLENTADVTNLKSTTWATAISTMTSVYSGAYAVPAVAGPTTVLTLSTGFVYTGGSVYVAYDYLGSTFTTTSGTYSANNSIGGGWIGQVNATTIPAATLGQSSSFRPCFQFTFANPFSNELNVSGVAGEKGIFNNTIKTTQTVTSLISNTSVAAIANVPVTLTVAGANPYTITQTIPTIASGGTATLLFNNVPSVNLGTQTVTISIPADDVPGNNTQVFNQQVQCDTIGYTQTPVQSGGVGFNTGAGLIAVRHVIPATIETYVTSVSNYFPTALSNAGNTMKGILLDANGVILDSTNVINTTAGMLGTKQNFDFINGAIDVSGGAIYVGFRQDANTVTGYFPFANQANSYVDPNAAATFGVFGGVPAPLGSGLGYVMIDAALAYGGFNVANSSTAGTLCSNSTLTISPTVGYTNYEFFVDGSSVQNGATPTHTTGPISTTTTYNVDITNGACVINSNLQTITIVPALINNIADGICLGQTYTFGSQSLTAAGTYADTLLSTAGCDSIVNLTLNVLVPTASSSTVTACANTYQFGGQSLTASGTYTNTVLNAAGCDSVITLNLTLNAPAVVTATLTGVTLTATGTPGSITYQWIDCGTNLPVSGATSATFNPTLNGSYAVIAQTTDGCEDTSACLTVSTIGLDELLVTSVLVYPNPATNEINAVTNGMQILSYAVLDANGRVVLSKTLNENTTEIGISLESISEGTYILELKTSESSVYKRFVKN
ncbi:MAG: hypothetical protein ACJA0U_002847 [Salibacteraceae bacterium]|jgi:hypothetical protein